MPAILNETCQSLLKEGHHIVTWFLVILGWIIVNRLNASREKNKDLRELIESIRSETVDIERLGIAYHSTQSQKFETTEHDIIVRIDRVLSRLDYIEPKFCQHELIEFKKAITLSNFQAGSSNRQRYDIGSEFINNIRGTSKDLCSALERKFHSLY